MTWWAPTLAVGVVLASASGQDNVIVVVADDVGLDRVGVYGDPAAGPTLVLDALAADGVLFRGAWSPPVCSPSRAAMLTGRHGFRTGVGSVISWDGSTWGGAFVPDPEESTLPERLAATHRTFAVGKWHLAPEGEGAGWAHPIEFGFERFSGVPENLGAPHEPEAWFAWEKNVADADGHEQIPQTGYVTTDQVDDALAFIAEAGDDPWFVWLAFSAAHLPLHVPPASLTTQRVTQDSSPADKHRAMVEAMDTEIGRLLAGLPRGPEARTWIVVVGDNGTPAQALDPGGDPDHAKGSLYEGGIAVPLIVAGPGVQQPGREVETLVHVVDVFATVLELAGHEAPTDVDGRSLRPFLVASAAPPVRATNYSEKFAPNGHGEHDCHLQHAIRSERYKLIRRPVTTCLGWGTKQVEFYDLWSDPGETEDLVGDWTPGARQAFEALDRELQRLLASEPGPAEERP